MVALTKVLGVLITLFGLAILVVPKITEKVFAFFMEGKKIYLAGAIRTVTGATILLAMPESALPLAAFALGVMFLVSGIIIFVADMEKLKAFMAHYREMPELIMRLFGLLAATFGILIFAVF